MKILCVDDDPTLLQELVEVLKNEPGYQTVAGANGGQALMGAAEMQGVDLLITDVVMDPMDGFTLRQKLLERYPEMKTIFVSGYDLSDYAAYTAGCHVFTKPLDFELLREAVAGIAVLLSYRGHPRPVAAAAPVPVAKPVPVPVAAPVPVAIPVAVSVAAPVPVATDIPAAAPEAVEGGDPLVNKKIGNYKIISRIGEDEEWGGLYLANQTSMARPVAMTVLSEEILQKDPSARQRFTSVIQAKASVKYPAIISVFEAGEADGYAYYTSEYVEGNHLAALREEGVQIDDKTALRLAKTAVEGVCYLQDQEIPRRLLSGKTVFLDKNADPHLANLAVLPGEGQQDLLGEAAELGAAISGLLPKGVAANDGLQKLLARMTSGEGGTFKNWEELLGAINELAPKVIPADAVKITATEQVAIRAVEKMKREQKRSTILAVLGFVLALIAAGAFIYWKFFWTNERDLSEMVKIPAGEFVFREGKKATTGEFWIDKYEVTVAQYGRFLEAIKNNPTRYDSPDQPKAKTSHIPDVNATNWNKWYGRAKLGLPTRFVPIDLNCPIFNIDYWDACAYANWAGKRLPTELEWEKAARGEDGRRYPWGNEFREKSANLGKDYIQLPGPKSQGAVDGYFWWNPVDAIPGDTSPYGAVGMLGNMAEWTSTFDAVGKSKSKGPVVRGGSFHKDEATLLNRVAVDPSTMVEYVGFRCVSDKPVKK